MMACLLMSLANDICVDNAGVRDDLDDADPHPKTSHWAQKALPRAVFWVRLLRTPKKLSDTQLTPSAAFGEVSAFCGFDRHSQQDNRHSNT
jgi:hypothetical protein